jgi:hypothetical protein
MNRTSPGAGAAALPSKKRATIARLLKEARQAFSVKGLAGRAWTTSRARPV